jgi:RNA polymerase sigma-70 factor (ECF subfamily)
METKLQSATRCINKSFEGLYKENVKNVYYYALRMLGSPADAEDATHDVFVKAFRAYEQFRNESNPKTWLYRITVNHCNSLLKLRAKHPMTDIEESNIETQNHIYDYPIEVVEHKELGLLIQKTLEKLPIEYRMVLLLAKDENLSYEEIGQLTNQTIDAVRGKLHRARKLFIYYFKKMK